MVEHYFDEKPRSLFRAEEFDIELAGQKYHIHSGSSIFSRAELDFGTFLLCENMMMPSDAQCILDLGCGYGIVGLHVKRSWPDKKVYMVDINERAIRCAKKNVEENLPGAQDVFVFKSDIFSHPNVSELTFDLILSNPPFSAGKNVCFNFIKESFTHLNLAGQLQIVAPHNKGGESLKKYMLSIFGNVGELAKKRGFRVYMSIKNSPK